MVISTERGSYGSGGFSRIKPIYFLSALIRPIRFIRVQKSGDDSKPQAGTRAPLPAPD
jgi:hypothetical protein